MKTDEELKDEAWAQAKQLFNTQNLTYTACSVCKGLYPCLYGLCFGDWYLKHFEELKEDENCNVIK